MSHMSWDERCLVIQRVQAFVPRLSIDLVENVFDILDGRSASIEELLDNIVHWVTECLDIGTMIDGIDFDDQWETDPETGRRIRFVDMAAIARREAEQFQDPPIAIISPPRASSGSSISGDSPAGLANGSMRLDRVPSSPSTLGERIPSRSGSTARLTMDVATQVTPSLARPLEQYTAASQPSLNGEPTLVKSEPILVNSDSTIEDASGPRTPLYEGSTLADSTEIQIRDHQDDEAPFQATVPNTYSPLSPAALLPGPPDREDRDIEDFDNNAQFEHLVVQHVQRRLFQTRDPRAPAGPSLYRRRRS